MPAVESFLKTIVRSGLLSREQLQEALRGAADLRDDPAALADFLVKSGKLSRFQAKKLLQGKSVGLVLGPFQVLAPVGKGGMSTVYLARDTHRHCLVALKVLPPKKAREEERLLARFLREMKMCQRVSHPHLAQTYEVGHIEGVHYIAMEFIPGRSLYRLVTDEGPLTVPRAARLFAEVAAALDHAHWRGLIHRDMKPSNILITPNDHAKVLDLGLALIQGEIPTDHTVVGGQGYVVGTMDYLAPEQSEDASKVDPRSDIYGLGCTLYFTLTGRPPFPGGTAIQKIMRHRGEEPTPVWQLNSSVPLGFLALLSKMMQKRPEHRFVSAAALRKELLAWRGEESARPSDVAGDANYQQAVALLESREAPSEDFSEVLANAHPVRGRPALFAALHLNRLGSPAPRPSWTGYLISVGLGALLGLAMLLVWFLFLRR
jgi:serine/threonine protein kinase